VTTRAVTITGSVSVLVTECKRIHLAVQRDLARLLADGSLLDASAGPPRAGNIGLVRDGGRDVVHRARKCALVSLAGADLVAGIHRKREVVRPVDDVRRDREGLTDLELLGRPSTLDSHR